MAPPFWPAVSIRKQHIGNQDVGVVRYQSSRIEFASRSRVIHDAVVTVVIVGDGEAIEDESGPDLLLQH